VVQLTLPPMVAWLARALEVAEVTPAAAATRGLEDAAAAAVAGGWLRARTAQWRRRLAAVLGVPPPARAAAVTPRASGRSASARLDDTPFWDWVQRQEQKGEIDFDVKG
jgi:hypothetical protein